MCERAFFAANIPAIFTRAAPVAKYFIPSRTAKHTAGGKASSKIGAHLKVLWDCLKTIDM